MKIFFIKTVKMSMMLYKSSEVRVVYLTVIYKYTNDIRKSIHHILESLKSLFSSAIEYLR